MVNSTHNFQSEIQTMPQKQSYARRIRNSVLAFVAMTATASQFANADDFSVYTRVYDMRAAATAKKTTSMAPVARIHSLFHAGKAYDHLDSMGEVIVFEPVRRQFTLLNIKHRISTTVPFDEVQRRLALAEEETRNWIAKLKQSNNPKEKKAIAPLQFQLDPQFTSKFREKQNQLTLASSFIRYQATCSTTASPATTELYLEYADWMSRLNYVLHPSAVLPSSRLALNEELKSHQLIPTTVELKSDIQNPILLKAVHQFDWSLDETEQRQIAYWESMLQSSQITEVTFQEYQSRVLVTSAQK